MSTETERTSSPLQRAWDESLLKAWRDSKKLSELLKEFGEAHMAGATPTKACGLLRLPVDDEQMSLSVRGWTANGPLKQVSQRMFKLGLYKPDAIIPEQLIDSLTRSALDCNRRVQTNPNFITHPKDARVTGPDGYFNSRRIVRKKAGTLTNS